jgi:hypothetical protein
MKNCLITSSVNAAAIGIFVKILRNYAGIETAIDMALWIVHMIGGAFALLTTAYLSLFLCHPWIKNIN